MVGAYLCQLSYLSPRWRCNDFIRGLAGRRGWYAKVLVPGYVAVGVMRVCNVVQFVPSPIMAGYQVQPWIEGHCSTAPLLLRLC